MNEVERSARLPATSLPVISTFKTPSAKEERSIAENTKLPSAAITVLTDEVAPCTSVTSAVKVWPASIFDVAPLKATVVIWSAFRRPSFSASVSSCAAHISSGTIGSTSILGSSSQIMLSTSARVSITVVSEAVMLFP